MNNQEVGVAYISVPLGFRGLIRAMAEAAGLEFVASSDVLANADDDHTLMVFDPSIRRNTDRFIMTFAKP